MLKNKVEIGVLDRIREIYLSTNLSDIDLDIFNLVQFRLFCQFQVKSKIKECEKM